MDSALLETPPMKKGELLRMLTSQNDPPVDTVEDIVGYMEIFRRKHEKELVLNRREKAAEVHTMMEHFSERAHRSLFDRRCETALGTLRSKLSTTNSDAIQFTEEADKNRRNFETSAQKRWDAMKRRHERELREHENKKPIITPAKFRRRSPEFLQLMRQERRLFFLSRFDEAAKIRAQLERMEKIESEKQNEEAMKHWETALANIQRKHRREEAAMQQWIDTRRSEYIQDKDAQIEAMDKRKKNLGRTINEKRAYKRAATSHAVRRDIMFMNDRPRGQIETTPVDDEIRKLEETLPQRAREVLLRQKW